MGNQYEFQKLTPSDNVEMGIYKKAMEYVFENDDIRNIAISGTYGAGKSSIVESYKKINPDKKFIHISLAHFISKDEVQPENNKRKVDVATLEGKIINQLVHQIEPQKISQTNFVIKRDIDEKKVFKVALITTIFIAITCFLRFKNTWEAMINGISYDWLRTLLHLTTTKEIELVLGTIALIILVAAIYEMIKLQKNKKMFKKFIFQGNEIEVFEESKDSYFDKYLNEVLYIFEHAEVDAIIFEDIDRYDTNLIFEKLREINYLLNQRKKLDGKVESKALIRFFYLLRDDIFESKDRTKFFDFILPVVPVVDASNAYDMFINYFKRGNIYHLFDAEFLQGLSLYVDDMRVLKNICNEFIIYHERLKLSYTVQNSNKLLAIIAYKNLFPKDFGDLQSGTGYVHTLFEQKENFRKREIERLQKEITSLQTENLKMNHELCNDLDELNALYLSLNGRIRVEYKEESAYTSRKEFVKAVLTSKNVERYTSGWYTFNVDSAKKAMEENSEYIERKSLITKRADASIQKNKQKIEILKTKLEKVEHAYLKDIISSFNETDFFSVNHENPLKEIKGFEEIKRSSYFPLIKFLIRNGYIDETYSDYMTYFYENSITACDKAFLRSITDKDAKSFDYELKDVSLVISRMRIVDFQERESLNFKLLEQLLSNTVYYEKQLAKFLENIWFNQPEEFLVQFLQKSSARKMLVRELTSSFEKVCAWILLSDGLPVENKRQYIADVLCVCSNDVISENNEDKEITQFIERDCEFLSLQDIDESMIEQGLKQLETKFNNINFETANKRLLRFVYENNMYQINMEMIHKILNWFYVISDEEDILHKNLSLILSKEEEPLCSYVKDNINWYIEKWLSNESEIRDEQTVIEYVLNSEDIAEENKRKYIASIQSQIGYLKDITDIPLWSVLLEQDKVEKNVENLYDYYYLSGNGLDNCLLSYINRFSESPVLNAIDLNKMYGESSKQNLFDDIVQSNQINNSKYSDMVCSFDMVCTTLLKEDLLPEKLDILIQHDIIKMNSDNLVFMRKYYSEKCMPFIISNIDEYVEIMSEDIFVSSELHQLLETEISDEIKIELLQFETEPISIRNKKYSYKVQDFIVEKLFCNDDFQYVVQWYPKDRIQLRKTILNLAINSIQDIKAINCLLQSELLEGLLQSNLIDIENKIEVLAHQIEVGMDKVAVRSALKQLGLSEYIHLLEGKRPKVHATIANETLLKVLLKKEWISSYGKDKADADYFQTYGKVIRKK